MIVINYDGSMDGLMSALYECFKENIKVDVFKESDIQIPMLDVVYKIENNEYKSDYMREWIIERMGPEAMKMILYGFLSDDSSRGDAIYNFVRYGRKTGKEAIYQMNHPQVELLHKLRRKVMREIHLFLGILRFKEVKGGIYYCDLEPQYNIVPAMATHFAHRMMDQNWIIHDKRRELAVIYNGKKWHLLPMKRNIDVKCTEEETYFQDLWKTYFNTIAIDERLNPRCQMNHIPKMYWKYLTEM